MLLCLLTYIYIKKCILLYYVKNIFAIYPIAFIFFKKKDCKINDKSNQINREDIFSVK